MLFLWVKNNLYLKVNVIYTLYFRVNIYILELMLVIINIL